MNDLIDWISFQKVNENIKFKYEALKLPSNIIRSSISLKYLDFQTLLIRSDSL